MADRKQITKTVNTKKTVTKKISPKNKHISATNVSESRVSTDTPDETAKSPRHKKLRKFLLPALIVLVISAALYLIMTKLVVAWVDKRPIFAFQYYSQLDAKYGQALKNQMVSEQLVEDEANNQHVSATDQEVNNQIKTIYDQDGGQANVNQILASQGLTQDEFKRQVKLQILINKMFGKNVTVTDKEINQYINDNKSQFPDVNDTVKAQVKEQLKSDKIRSAFQEWLQKALQDKSRVIIT